MDPPYQPYQRNVSLTAPVIVTFSEPMREDSIRFSWILHGRPTVTPSWDPTGTILSFTHADPYEPCRQYGLYISDGYDLEGDRLAEGNRGTNFTTVCDLDAPMDLGVTELPPDSVLLTWTAVPGAMSYEVFASSNRFAAFPSGWTLLADVTTTQHAVTGHLSDGASHFYAVRAVNGAIAGAPSAMGAKIALSFAPTPAATGIAWFSLPCDCVYARASDIAAKLGSDNIDVVGKWDPAGQRSTVYYFARGGWRGTDFAIRTGDGLYLGVRRPFTWIVTGTDVSTALSFATNEPSHANVHWFGMPYAAGYCTASDVANELGPARIAEVGVWDSESQTAIRWYWSGSAWAGSDFAITPGTGTYLVVTSSFTWTAALIAPAAP